MDTSMDCTLQNSNDTHLKDSTEDIKTRADSDDLEVTMYDIVISCVVQHFRFNMYSLFYFFLIREPNVTKISQLSYHDIEVHENNSTTIIRNEESSTIEHHEPFVHHTEEDVSFNEKEKKSSNGYAETSLDEATNYSLLCEDDDNGEKALTGDTTQTYCTEGTPYNFSNAASYTDLRKCGIEDKVIKFKKYFYLFSFNNCF